MDTQSDTGKGKIRVYISGPISGIKDGNRPAFYRAAERLTDMGYMPINPHEIPPPACGTSWEDYMRADIAELLECDAIHLLPGWESSRGAWLEHVIAEALSMPVIKLPAE